jgi:DNA-binding Lrp family transcriptional regulator
MADLLATASELKIREQIVDTIQAVRVVVARRNDPHSDGAKIREIADELALDKTAAWRRVRKAEQEGYIYNLEERKGRAGRYCVAGEVLSSKGEVLSTAGEALSIAGKLLPLPNDISAELREAKKRKAAAEKKTSRREVRKNKRGQAR